MAPPAIPQTPRKEKRRDLENIKVEQKFLISSLCKMWDLKLVVPPENESPSKRAVQTPAQLCVSMITLLVYKREYSAPLKYFEVKAGELYMKWLAKPKQERGVLPVTNRSRAHPLTEQERVQMTQLLYDCLKGPYEDVKTQSVRSLRRLHPAIDDSPIPIALSSPASKLEPKRSREDQGSNQEASAKRVKTPDDSPTILPCAVSTAMLPPPPTKPHIPGPNRWGSANTSFESNDASSIFSDPNMSQYFGALRQPDTQETIPDLEELANLTEGNDSVAAPIAIDNSSDYGGRSSFEDALRESADIQGLITGTKIATGRVEDGLSQELQGIGLSSRTGAITDEEMLQERLNDVFPKLPPSLKGYPMNVIYEIVRVCLHTEVSMDEINFSGIANSEDYDALWRFLCKIPALKGKSFPERSEKDAWAAANVDYTSKGLGVVLGGSLEYNAMSLTGPFFKFRLKKMALDKSHRLSRQLGNDRFLELDMPHLVGEGLPPLIRSERGHELLMNWLVDTPHWLFGRSWKPFHCKPKEKKKDKKASRKELDLSHCVYFFAVNVSGIRPLFERQGEDLPKNMEISALLDVVRLIRKNKHQSFLKLFSRTSLAVSRNSPTAILERSEIRYKKDIEFNGEVMTDGAGRISKALSYEIMSALELSNPASGFQARIGEAKGFWSVDQADKSGQRWIEVYASQCKWKRSRNHLNHDRNHRTFEVLKPSGPLKSADLNLQLLPLLIDRARDPLAMKESLKYLLEKGLSSQLEDLRSSMLCGRLLRQWMHEKNPNQAQRLKQKHVPYCGGLPSLPDERLIMLLDAGFLPHKLKYAMDLSRRLFKNKCDDLKKRLNITVGKSTYAYMVPDFYGVLEPDEIYIDFSDFKDKVSDESGVLLHGQELLVARSPAHFVSDIQKVKAVAKVEFMGMKDVIVFPTKGNPSLAAKLSGGDYDGDMAWICWEPRIVDNFENADVPEMPDLVAEGYIQQNKTTYQDLVEGREDSVSYFLKKSLAFNMQQSMLGTCTIWKETFCYNQGSVGTPEATIISTLLSSLVDQAKQGYSFTEHDWKRLKDEKLKPKNFKMHEPEYKKENPHFKREAKHVIDYLMWVAQIKTKECLAEFETGLPKDISNWDDDLAAVSKWAEEEAETCDEWKLILKNLSSDLDRVKQEWARKMAREKKQFQGDDEDTGFSAIVLVHYNQYFDIKPHEVTPLTQTLNFNWALPELSPWSLLKASALFKSYRGNTTALFPWFMGGRQLAYIKTLRMKGGAPHFLVPHMYISYKPNPAFIKQAQSLDLDLVDNVGISNADEISEMAN